MLAAASEVDQVARGIAGIALVVSILAAVFARQQAQGQRAANAPTVKAEANKSDRKRPDGSSGTLRLTFETSLHINSATVTIRDGSALTALGAPDASTVDQRTVTLTDIASGAEVILPASYVEGGERAKLAIKMKGTGFGTVRTNVDPEVGGGPFFFFVY